MSFSPSAAPAPCGPATLTQAAGSTSATITFQRSWRQHFDAIQLRVDRAGQRVFTEAESVDAFGDADSLTVRDLDGDGEPEVVLALFVQSDRLQWSRIYRYDAKRNTYTVLQRYWGDKGTEPVLRDLDHDGRPELVSNDGRYSDKYNEFTPSAMPIQIWTYRAGRLRDVTRRYPRQIRSDAAAIWRYYVKYRSTARWTLPAWAAEEYMLGHRALADRALERAAARGELRDGEYGGPYGSKAFIRAVKKLIRRTGYSRKVALRASSVAPSEAVSSTRAGT